jgi:hypothetical protein
VVTRFQVSCGQHEHNIVLWFAKIVNSREMKPMAGAPKGLEFVQDWHHDSPS